MQQFRVNILGVAQMQNIGIELGNSMSKLCVRHFITELTETKQNIFLFFLKHWGFFHPSKLKSSFGF
jgi:hypothetical protein